MSLHSEVCWEGCPTNRRQSQKSGRRISGHLPTLIFIIYGLLKMSSGSTVPDQDPELINAQKLQISPNYSPKEICSYIDLHPSQNPFQLHNGCQHEVSHCWTVQLTSGQTRRTVQIKWQIRHDFSLAITEGSRKDFRYIIKALPHKTEISMPGRSKRFIAIGNSNHTHGPINIQKHKGHSRKREETKWITKRKEKTQKWKRYISEDTRTKKIIHTKCNLNFQINIPKKGKDKRQFQLQIANLNFKISSSKHYPKLIFTN